MSQFSPISVIADFATLVGTYNDGFTLLIEPYDERTPNIIDPISYSFLVNSLFFLLSFLFFFLTLLKFCNIVVWMPR